MYQTSLIHWGRGYVEDSRDYIAFEKDHRATQIDHILVCCHGVFAIETKYLSGHIIGVIPAGYWKQVTPAGTERFYSTRYGRTITMFGLWRGCLIAKGSRLPCFR